METKNFEKKLKYKKPDTSPMLYGKSAPQATDLEEAILGGIMLDAHKLQECAEILKSPECFYSDANQRIFASIRRLFDAGQSVDFLTVTADLRKNGELEMVGGSYYVTKLTRDVTNFASLDEYCKIVVQKFMSRELIRICGDKIGMAYEEDSDIFDLIADTEKQLETLSEENISIPYKHVSHNISDDISEITMKMEKIKNQDYSISGVDTGFNTLNDITDGWQSGEMIILAARPSVGKTAFALNLAYNSCHSFTKKVNVGLFSLEMTMDKLRLRLHSMINEIGITDLRKGTLSDAQFDRLGHGIKKFKDMGLYIDDSFNLNLFEFKNKARRMVKKHQVGLIIIDYLQLMTATNTRAIREQQVSEISREIKRLTKELNIPIIALSQLSREIEKKGNVVKEPGLSDLRESGAIEQDADMVMFLYRDNGIVLKIAKNRNGKIDKMTFDANMDIQKFYEQGGMPEKIRILPTHSATPYSGKLIPLEVANKKFEDEDDLPF